MGLDEQTIDSLMSEIGLDDENYMDTVLEEAVADTVWQKASQTVNAVFFTIIKYLFRTPYQKFLSAVRAILPQFFILSATGTWLELWAGDFDLERDLGHKAQHRVRIVKDTDVELDLLDTDVFYVDELNPRRFLIDQAYNFPTGVTECLILVEADDIGTDYNVITDQISKCERSIPVTSIANYEQVVTGANVETDDELRARIQDKRFANKLEYGVEQKYISALKSVAEVKHAILASVDDSDATMNFTVYGDGILSQEKIDEAQLTLQDYLMETDKSVVTGATPEALVLTVKINTTYDETDVRTKIGDWFAMQTKDANFESSLLIDHLYEQYPAWEDVVPIRIDPPYDDLSSSSFYTVTVNFAAWA